MPPEEQIRRRHLPHWDVSSAAYFVTTCLDGSIPAQGLVDIEGYRTHLQRRSPPAGKTQQEWQLDQWKLTFARTEEWLDQRPVVRHLADERLAQVVVDACYHFAGERYDLLAFVVMPSHLHWVFQPCDAWVAGLEAAGANRSPRERIQHSLNRFTAAECNRLLGLAGAFWQHESYDHWVRSPEELERILLYVEANPVKAGLVESPGDWPFSSARDRILLGGEWGQPLVRLP